MNILQDVWLFLNPTVLLQEYLLDPKESEFDKNLRIFPNVALFLVATPLVNTKIDLNAWNKHSVKYFTSFKIRCYL